MIHVRRGGSNGTTKDKDARFVPIHPKVADLLPRKKGCGVLLSTIKERKLLGRVKTLCAECKFEVPTQYKLHTFRHHFASICANHRVAYRKALTWLGHSSSDILDLYYHLHDEDSQHAMMELARSHDDEPIEPDKGNGGVNNKQQSTSAGATRAYERYFGKQRKIGEGGIQIQYPLQFSKNNGK